MASYTSSGAWWPEAMVIAIGVLPWAIWTGNFGFAGLGAVFLGLAIMGRRRARKARAMIG